MGLSAILTTGLWGAPKVIGIDTNKFRLEKALEFGATDVVEVGPGTVADVIALTDGLGVDVAIEAVGYPETLLTAASLVRPGGSIANIGVQRTQVGAVQLTGPGVGGDQERAVQQPGQAVVPVPAGPDHSVRIHQDQGRGQVPGQLEELVEGVLGRRDHR